MNGPFGLVENWVVEKISPMVAAFAVYPALVVAGQALPLPPSPEQLEPYGWAGIIFGTLIAGAAAAFWAGFKLIVQRDRDFLAALSTNQATVKELAAAHQAAVERVVVGSERVGDRLAEGLAIVQREMVAHGARLPTEETLARIVQRAVYLALRDGQREPPA